ncbi:MAG: hypothetical protein ACREJ3_08160, partial [Polyangiaceae bacterium]
MRKWPLVVLAVFIGLLIFIGQRKINHRPFPPDTTPEGAYVRIARAVTAHRSRDAFPYLETEAQWASYTIRDMRKKASERVRASYPHDQRGALLAAWADEAQAPDGADVFALLA